MTHPAQFTPSIIHYLSEVMGIPPGARVLDPCAGVGLRLAALCGERGWRFYGTDIEAWKGAHPNVSQRDARDLDFPSNYFDAAVTSVTYANGLADKGLNMADPKGRRTYDLALGRPLQAGNTGAYGVRQGQPAYVQYLHLHARIFEEVHRVLKPGAYFWLNCSDVIKNGRVIPVTNDNVGCAIAAGFFEIHREKVDTPRYGFGANAEVRVDGEDVVCLQKQPRKRPKRASA